VCKLSSGFVGSEGLKTCAPGRKRVAVPVERTPWVWCPHVIDRMGADVEGVCSEPVHEMPTDAALNGSSGWAWVWPSAASSSSPSSRKTGTRTKSNSSSRCTNAVASARGAAAPPTGRVTHRRERRGPREINTISLTLSTAVKVSCDASVCLSLHRDGNVAGGLGAGSGTSKTETAKAAPGHGSADKEEISRVSGAPPPGGDDRGWQRFAQRSVDHSAELDRRHTRKPRSWFQRKLACLGGGYVSRGITALLPRAPRATLKQTPDTQPWGGGRSGRAMPLSKNRAKGCVNTRRYPLTTA